MTEQAFDPPDQRLEILLVEDTLDEALMIRTLLEKSLGDCKITLAQDGIRGCQLAENQTWSLVVTDINLPGRDGTEVIATSKKSFPDTPVLATTGFTGPEYFEKAGSLGADEILSKPLDPAELLETVKRLLEARPTPELTETDEEGPERTILAVGALPGDVELGCGGILLGHRSHGHRVVVLVLCGGCPDDEIDRRTAEAARAAKTLDVEIHLAEPFDGDIPGIDAMAVTVRRAIQEIDPDTLYTPTSNEVRDSRLGAFRAGQTEGATVPNHYCYQAATTTLEFRPSLFIDVAEFMDTKVAALEHFRSEQGFRPHLQPEIAHASARYWGRFLGYGMCEPLEVHRSEV